MTNASTTRWSWSIAASPMRCAVCRRRTSPSLRDQDLPPVSEVGDGDSAECESDPGAGQDRP